MGKSIKKEIAVVAITNEVVKIGHAEPRHERVLIVGRNTSGENSQIRPVTFREKDLKKAREGGYVEEDPSCTFMLSRKSMIYPRTEDLLRKDQYGFTSVEIFKLFNFGDDYFEDMLDGGHKQLSDEVKEYARNRYSLPEEKIILDFVCSLYKGSKTPAGSCRKGFKITPDGSSWTIQERFGLEKFVFGGEFTRDGFVHPNSLVSERLDFMKKYPDLNGSFHDSEVIERFTVKRYAEMIYDICKIKYKNSI